MPVETIKVGKYTFVITENKLVYSDKIISHTFKIGGSYDDCISISYTYNNNNDPISAKILFVRYEPECTMANDLEKGGGTAIMLKTLLRYLFKKIPSVHIFSFEDMSHIDCVEKDLSKPPPRKPLKPLSLAYLSIAYNSCTWYEKHFDARMIDHVKYSNYKEAVKFLTKPGSKVDFVSFLQIAKPPQEQFEYLEKLYNQTNTYRSFFDAIPFEERCDLLRPWLKTFIEYYLGDTYDPYNWEINVLSPKIQTGGRRCRGGTMRRRKIDSFFPSSNYRITMYNEIHSL